MKPFSEDARPEQGNGSDPFYATGSIGSIGENPGSFSTALSNKEQIRLSFAVKNKVQMLPNSSSIYYFNVASGQWNIPSKALSDHVGPFGNVSVKTNGTAGSLFIEDSIGFDYKANAIVSGSLSIQRNISGINNTSQKIENGPASFLGTNNPLPGINDQIQYMLVDFPKSSQRNSDYNASNSEVFELPISAPFLIEKIVYEIPFCMGSGWFYDKSSVNVATSSLGDFTVNGIASGYTVPRVELLDQGGPGITLSIFCQKNYGSGTIRDLICHDLVSHESDITKEIVLSPIFSGSSGSPTAPFSYWALSIKGLDENLVDSIVSPIISGNTKYFTGSIRIKSEASVSNGVHFFTLDTFKVDSSASELTDWVSNKLSLEYSKMAGSMLAGIDSFGRGMTGFSPSGGSIFGGEYTSSQDAIRKDGSSRNSFYISSSSSRQSIIDSLTPFLIQGTAWQKRIFSISKDFYGSKKSSPYLVYPGEKLVLAASKTRPAFKNLKVDINTSTNPDAETKGIGTLLSSSYINSIPCTPSLNGHDVQFNTGSINMTFYGSYVRGGNSYIP